MSTDARATHSSGDHFAPTASRENRGRWLPLWGWIVLLVSLAAVVCVRNLDTLDRAIVNIITLVCTFLAGMSIFVWFCFFSGYGRRLRMGLLMACVMIVASLVACLKIVSVSGELIPKFAFRWTGPPDRTLGAVVPGRKQNADRADSAEPSPVGADGNTPDVDGAADVSKPMDPLRDAKPVCIDLKITTADDFPQFLGPQRSGWMPDPGLSSDWVTQPPALLWRQPIGAGWSAFSVVNGYALTLEQRGDEECVTCYEALSGKLMWLHADAARHETTLGGIGPRSSPTIYKGRVYALGATGILNCLDGATGDVRWTHRLQEEYGLTAATDLVNMAWGRAGSPLIVDDLVVVPGGGPAPGRKVSLVAFQQDTGDRIWEDGDDQIAYASPSLVTLSGVRQILIVNEKTVAGHDSETGRVFWSFPWSGNSNQNANNSQAVVVGDERVFVSKGYSGGSALFQVQCDAAGKWKAEQIWADSKVMKTKFTNVVIRDGQVYGLSDGTLECIDLETGKRRWKHGRYGHGQILGVGDLLIVQAESGDVFLVAATPDEHRELGQLRALDGKTWNNPVLYGRYLLVRNGEQAACYELPLK